MADIFPDLPCHRCGYDLRAHAADGKCPECGEPVAESRRIARIPRRPPWRDSDPRWRRRMLAGVWILAMLPVLDVMLVFGWTSAVRVPSLFRYGARTLGDTLFCEMRLDQLLLFCIGAVLLFSKERGPHLRQLEWTRRWGILCTYITLLLGAAQVLFIVALVLVGISAMFLTIPLKYQPGVTRFFVEVSAGYLRHGPSPKPITDAVQLAFASVVILLACVPLFNALRSSSSRRAAAIFVAPLALFSLIHLAQAGAACMHPARAVPVSLARHPLYFQPYAFVTGIASLLTHQTLTGSELIALMMELAKWCTIVAIAVWLTLARFSRRRSGTAAAGLRNR